MMRRVVALAAILMLAFPLAARADDDAIPPEVLNNPLVQSALSGLRGLLQTTDGNTAQGRVTYFQRYDLQIETAQNVFRSVHLHQGTVINPRGTTIRPGMTVDVTGTAQPDHSLDADVITVY